MTLQDLRYRARLEAWNLRIRATAALDAWQGHRRLKALFLKRVGYPLNLEAPRRYNEKVQWRKVHDRNPLFPIVSDKLRVHEFAADRIGRDRAERLTLGPLFVARHPDEVAWDDLPDSYVVKVNHASGRNMFVRDGAHPRAGEPRRRLIEWVVRDYGVDKAEWAYSMFPKRLFAEPVVLGPDGSFPDDVKFYMFDGRCYTIHHNVYGRQETRLTPKILKKVFMSPRWEKMDIASKEPSGDPSPRPACLDEMLELAERLSAGFDFIRVDFLALPDRFYLGEMTVYPSSGMKPLTPIAADDAMGAVWTLPGRNRREAVA